MAERHLAKIDFLRGIAILMVFLFHAQLVLFPRSDNLLYSEDGTMSGSASDILLKFSPTAFGWSGVQLFLLISGYVIHRNFLNHGSNFQAGTYFSKRFWRIYPPYIITLAATVLMIAGLRAYVQTSEGFIDLLQHVFLVHNFSEKNIYGINPSLWSLALEMQLYLLYPIFLIIRKLKGVGFAFIISILLAIVLKVFENRLTDGYYHASYYFSTGALWYNWCAGALMAEYHLSKKQLFSSSAGLVSIGAMIIYMGSRYFEFHPNLMLFTAVLFWTAFMEWYLLKPIQKTTGLAYRALVSMGICSYSLYLIHQPIIHELFTLSKKMGALESEVNYYVSGIILLLLSFIIIYIIAWILYKYIELPSIKLGSRLRNNSRPAPPLL
ncbi:acyltransferase [Flavihumibacter sp. ZG627]|uniref:acyltransferase family protein n=1 Tax=Flavihumibacter sp. ZG627 TaxID=1463156 RepID=UPI000907D74E|nr:acyltransferase [Flavihumibacter sp. ZG627]